MDERRVETAGQIRFTVLFHSETTRAPKPHYKRM
jgi:hypothetical protein